MAENKKSFILYTDITHTVELLSNEEKGKLFQFILDYVNDKDPITTDIAVKLAFEPIKQQFKRDLIKWEQTRGKRSEAGKASAEARKLLREKEAQQEVTNPTSVKSVEQDSTNPTVSVNANVTVTVNDTDIKRTIEYRETEFKNSLHPFVNAYPIPMLEKFYLYWTEKKPKGRKMRFEMQKTFDVGRRLVTWNDNNSKFNNNKHTKNERLNEITATFRDINPNL